MSRWRRVGLTLVYALLVFALRMSLVEISFTLSHLRSLYLSGKFRVEDVITESWRRASDPGHPHVWITLLSLEQILEYVKRLDPSRMGELPLYGIPFGIKDNIDLSGVPTTCACPAFSYIPAQSSTVVERLIQAGAIPIGKTNLDQFATGLVGTRSPYGACRSVFNKDFISGGSSSGSAVATAAGMVSFALGTDTAGSGRVPAGFNNIVGLKPTRGAFSKAGLVPACRSLDCISVFAMSCHDAEKVWSTAIGLDDRDASSREVIKKEFPQNVRFGVPDSTQLEFFGDKAVAQLYENACVRLEQMGATRVPINLEPFLKTASLLYAGPWLAERYWSVGKLLEEKADQMDPVVRQIIARGKDYSAVDTFDALYKLEDLAREAKREWAKMDFLLLPTTGTTYTVEQIQQDPIQLNSNLGRYTNFVNLLDLSAVAVPAGFTSDRHLPAGVTLMAPAFAEQALLVWGDKLHRAAGGNLGITKDTMHEQPVPSVADSEKWIPIAVVGAHLLGQPLHHQLSSRKARFISATETAHKYKLYSLKGTVPPKPGLVRMDEPTSQGIKVEVWALRAADFGDFVSEVPSPMAIGTLELVSGEKVKGFVCEPSALNGALDITEYGGWVAFLKSLRVT